MTVIACINVSRSVLKKDIKVNRVILTTAHAVPVFKCIPLKLVAATRMISKL